MVPDLRAEFGEVGGGHKLPVVQAEYGLHEARQAGSAVCMPCRITPVPLGG